MLIRLIVIPPAERLLEQIAERFRNWGLRCHFTIYVDGALAATTGNLSGVALLHSWLSRLVLNFI